MNDGSVFCAAGRLKFANIPHTSKKQMTVSKSYYTLVEKHCLILNFYWIPLSRVLIRAVLRECFYCKQYTVKAKTTYMADLSKGRMLAGQKLFTSTRIDLFGPMLVKRTKRTRSNAALVKCYGIIFTWMAVQAGHLKLTND